MAVGDIYLDSPEVFVGGDERYRVIRPVCHDGNRSMYFTSNPFTGREGEVIFSGVRAGQENFYLLNFLTGEYCQLTDAPNIAVDRAFYDRNTDTLFYGDERGIFGVQLRTLVTRQYYEAVEGLGSLSVTCDGRYLVTFAQTNMVHRGNDPSAVFQIPMWRIFRIDLQSGRAQTIAYRNHRIDHIQCSPTDPQWFMYCAWGYHCTHQRMWRCNISGTDGGPLGRERPNEHRTHEYFLSDGRRVAFHGKLFEYGDSPEFRNIGNTWGCCEFYTGDERVYRCVPSNMQAGHSIVSHDGRKIVADGGGCISYVKLDDAAGTCTFEPIIRHGSSMSCNFVHPHPSFSIDDRYVIFATDRKGRDSGNIYLIDMYQHDVAPGAMRTFDELAF